MVNLNLPFSQNKLCQQGQAHAYEMLAQNFDRM